MNDMVTVHEAVDEKTLMAWMDATGVGTSLEPREKAQFLEVAKAYQLNPFKREIYCIPYGQGQYRKLSIITGYEVYLKRAERMGKLDGWKVEIEGSRDKKDLKAVVTIHRKDWREPFTHEAYWVEYAQENKMWKDKPVTMIKKVAIAQAFRMAFPDEMGGMPYTADELPDEMTIDVTPKQDRKTVPLGNYENTESTVKVPENTPKVPEKPKKSNEKGTLQNLQIVMERGISQGLIGQKELDATMKIAPSWEKAGTLEQKIREIQSRFDQLYKQKQEIQEEFQDDDPELSAAKPMKNEPAQEELVIY